MLGVLLLFIYLFVFILFFICSFHTTRHTRRHQHIFSRTDLVSGVHPCAVITISLDERWSIYRRYASKYSVIRISKATVCCPHYVLCILTIQSHKLNLCKDTSKLRSTDPGLLSNNIQSNPGNNKPRSF